MFSLIKQYYQIEMAILTTLSLWYLNVGSFCSKTNITKHRFCLIFHFKYVFVTVSAFHQKLLNLVEKNVLNVEDTCLFLVFPWEKT